MNREYTLEERTVCPVCQSQDMKFIFEGYDDRYGQPDTYGVYECGNSNCQLGFLKQHVKDNELSNLYSKYYHHKKNKEFKGQFIDNCEQHIKNFRNYIYNTENFYSKLKHGQTVLDIGCGYGPSAGFLKKKSIRWFGLEVDPLKVEFNKKKGLICDLKSVEEFSNDSKIKFDIIIVNQVIEHISNPIRFLSSIRKLIKDDGITYISTPNYNSKYKNKFKELWVHWHIPYHQLYFNSNSLSMLANKSGFNVDLIYTTTPFPFYVFQHNLLPCKQGEKNFSFHEKKTFKHLKYFLDYKNFLSYRLYNEDCLYAHLKPA